MTQRTYPETAEPLYSRYLEVLGHLQKAWGDHGGNAKINNEMLLVLEEAGGLVHRHAQRQPCHGALLELLSNAYNEGFVEGMREPGLPWSARKQKYSVLLDKALALSPPPQQPPAGNDLVARLRKEAFRDDDVLIDTMSVISEAAEEIERLRDALNQAEELAELYANSRPAAQPAGNAAVEALEFYADSTRYGGPNSRLEGEPDKYQPENLYYRLDVTRDGGRIARAALQARKAESVTPRCMNWAGDCSAYIERGVVCESCSPVTSTARKAESVLHEDAQGFHHVVKGERVPARETESGTVDPTRPACGQGDEFGHRPTDGGAS